ncbi:hypothetical protein [Flavilitoribacter nigricans]|uniref:Terminase n=1 Tax=Flavilitoribacter nigricans (strain ATCC 23147 / DSM 23189 / NBRC 102662 / NCIMB 1420 / SS-2) TaxID=1122177 RepID=A0A2D0MWJ2_FLAN2|nr:hypothetical protein [Flavilitoribacter nigricans]PHN00605.1 hypothetical protein CRP01_41365 [Flavilitoribacter nigricans DSM 23189 = NBRC 102662]
MGKLNDKQLLQEYEAKFQRIADSTVKGVPAFETEEEKQKRVAKALDDYEFFATYYFSDYIAGNKLAKFQKQAARYMDRAKYCIYLLQWFREAGKSVHTEIFYPMWQYYRGNLTGMITGSANEDLAMRLLFDIKVNFETNFKLIHDFGKRQSLGNWSMDNFITNDGIQFLPFGIKQSPRGTRFGPNRPNYGVIDDLNDKKSLKNDAISQEQFEWVKEDFIGGLNTKRWTCAIPQNKFHKNTITAKFEENKEVEFVKLHRVNILNDDGESNFPEHITTEEAIAKNKAMGYFSSQRENFNNPLEEGKIFKRDYIKWGKRKAWTWYDAWVAYADPSYKNSDKSDYKAVILVAKKGPRYFVSRAMVAKATIADMFEYHYTLDEEVGDHALIRHWMEANFIQGMHFKALEPLQKKHGRRLRVSGDMRSKPDKFQRISSMEPLFENGMLEFDQTQQKDPGMTMLIDQLCAFEKGSSVNDDGPDALEGAIYKLDEMQALSTPPKTIPRRKSKFAF